MASAKIIHADCILAMRDMPNNSVDSIVTDPPYGLGFMGKKWDDLPPGLDFAVEALRVLKPGGHILAFGGTRTWHRLAVAVEDAGFEIRDSIAWLYGQGFPKGGQLKPAFEPIVVGRKPLVGTVAQNILAYGTGALNIDAGRIEGEPVPINRLEKWSGLGQEVRPDYEQSINTAGRWPANIILDESQAAILDMQSGISTSVKAISDKPMKRQDNNVYGKGLGTISAANTHSDSGGASRFFYVAKAPKRERPVVDGVGHPTVKPLALMRYLVKLVTPPSGTVLEPFAGSGATVEAALLEGFDIIAIEREAEYLPLIDARIARACGTI